MDVHNMFIVLAAGGRQDFKTFCDFNQFILGIPTNTTAYSATELIPAVKRFIAKTLAVFCNFSHFHLQDHAKNHPDNYATGAG